MRVLSQSLSGLVGDRIQRAEGGQVICRLGDDQTGAGDQVAQSDRVMNFNSREQPARLQIDRGDFIGDQRQQDMVVGDNAASGLIHQRDRLAPHGGTISQAQRLDTPRAHHDHQTILDGGNIKGFLTRHPPGHLAIFQGQAMQVGRVTRSKNHEAVCDYGETVLPFVGFGTAERVHLNLGDAEERHAAPHNTRVARIVGGGGDVLIGPRE